MLLQSTAPLQSNVSCGSNKGHCQVCTMKSLLCSFEKETQFHNEYIGNVHWYQWQWHRNSMPLFQNGMNSPWQKSNTFNSKYIPYNKFNVISFQAYSSAAYL